MYFKPGTWWAYKNINTNLIDTIIVTGSNLDTITVKGHEEASYYRIYTYEYASLTAKSLKYNIYYQWYSREHNPDATGISKQISVWNRTSYGGLVSQCFTTPLELHYRPDIDLVTKDTTIQIGSKIYQNVQVFKIDRANAYYDILDPINYNNNAHSFLYYSKNYGLIKEFKTFENLSIELIESHILQ